MTRVFGVLLLILVCFGCTTIDDNSPPHTADDVTRSFTFPISPVLEACNLAVVDIGADHLEPVIDVKENSATITAATETCLYGILLLGYEDRTDAMLFLEDKSSKEVIKKTVFDEFWAAVESHL